MDTPKVIMEARNALNRVRKYVKEMDENMAEQEQQLQKANRANGGLKTIIKRRDVTIQKLKKKVAELRAEIETKDDQIEKLEFGIDETIGN
jgi:peptidoglycan hydrolase CwlO-like protein